MLSSLLLTEVVLTRVPGYRKYSFRLATLIILSARNNVQTC